MGFPRGGLLSSPTVQLHPTLRCNLSCSHCYSNSHPHAFHGLGADDWLARLSVLRDQGYLNLSLSGGEPILYPEFDDLVSGAVDMGFRVSMISNGTRVTPKIVKNLKGRINALAISFDGLQSLHDEIRGDGAYARAERGLLTAIDAGLVVGVSHCVSQKSLATLPDFLDQVEEWGARMVQLHALTPSGRGEVLYQSSGLCDTDLVRLMLIVEIAKSRYADEFGVQLDLLQKDRLLECIENFWVPVRGSASERLCDLVNPVILDADGSLYPHSYGISSKYIIASGGLGAFDSGIRKYAKSGLENFVELTKLCTRRLLSSESEVIDWYKLLIWESSQAMDSRSEKAVKNSVAKLSLALDN